MQNYEFDPWLIPHIKIHSRCFTDLYVKPETYKTSGRKIRKKSLHPWLSQRVFKYNTKSVIQKEKKITNWNFLNWVSSLKNTLKGVKIQATDWEKTFMKHIHDKRYVQKIYKSLKTQLEENKHPIFKGGYKKFEYIIKEMIQMTNT